jgi:hypothetical protein
VGTIKRTGEETFVVEGFWDEGKKVVQDPDKRDKRKKFQLTKKGPATLLGPRDDSCDTAEESDEEADYFSGGNCVGWFQAMAKSGEDASYDKYEDDMMLHMERVEDEESDEESAKEEVYEIKGMGCNSGGTYRVSGEAKPTKERRGAAAGELTVWLVREYISNDYFEEEKAKFNKFVSDEPEGTEGMVNFTHGQKHYLVSEVRSHSIPLTHEILHLTPAGSCLYTILLVLSSSLATRTSPFRSCSQIQLRPTRLHT